VIVSPACRENVAVFPLTQYWYGSWFAPIVSVTVEPDTAYVPESVEVLLGRTCVQEQQPVPVQVAG